MGEWFGYATGLVASAIAIAAFVRGVLSDRRSRADADAERHRIIEAERKAEAEAAKKVDLDRFDMVNRASAEIMDRLIKEVTECEQDKDRMKVQLAEQAGQIEALRVEVASLRAGR